MMNLNKTLISMLALAASIYTAPVFAAYTFTNLGTLGGSISYASGINNSGQIVGTSTATLSLWSPSHAFLYSNGSMQDLGTSDGGSHAYGISNNGQVAGVNGPHAFLFSNGNMQDLGTLGSPVSTAYDVNDAGEVVGDSYNFGFVINRAFLYSNGNMQDIGALGGRDSIASAINNAGQVVGTAYPQNNANAFLYSNGTMQNLGTLGGNESEAFGINENGLVVGKSSITGNAVNHAFLYSDGVMQDLGTLGGNNSEAFGINSANQIVGSSYISGNLVEHAFLYSNGIMTDLNSFLDTSTVNAGWILQKASAINDNGWIVGSAYNNVTRSYRAFLLTPVPEAETYAMLLVGLGVLGFTARRQQKSV